jgi:hypothetical protein
MLHRETYIRNRKLAVLHGSGYTPAAGSIQPALVAFP